MIDGVATSNANLVPLIFSTPVWGASHLGLFLNVGLPSLLSPGNLSGLETNDKNRFLIYTRPENEPDLKSSPAFHKLSRLLTVEVILISGEITEPHRTMSDCHIDSIRRADEADAAAVFLPPDCIWSDGSMVRLQELVASGKSIVHMSGIRLDRDAFVPELADYYSDENTILQIKARDLVRAALPHLHPIAHTHFWNEYEGGLMPANLIWTIPDEGLLLRCFHLHPLMVKSQIPFAKFESTIDDDLPLRACPDASRDYIVADSDELLAFEMSGLSRTVGTVCKKGSIEGVAGWAEFGTNERHRHLIMTPIRLHNRSADEAVWGAAERETGKIVNEISRLNALPATKLVFKHPTVFNGRLYAIGLGRGEHGGRRTLWIKIFVFLRKFLQVQRTLFCRLLFFRNGTAIMTHPAWLFRRKTIAAIAQCVRITDRHVVLIGADPGIGLEIERLCPGVKVQAFSSTAIPDPAMVRRQDRGEVDTLIVLDIRPSAEPPKQQHLGKRVILLRLTGDNRPVIEDPATVQYYGGLGTRFCAAFLNLGYRVRDRMRGKIQTLNSPVKAISYLVAPLVLGLLALCGFLINSTGLLLDRLSGEAKPSSTETPTRAYGPSA